MFSGGAGRKVFFLLNKKDNDGSKWLGRCLGIRSQLYLQVGFMCGVGDSKSDGRILLDRK